MWICVILRHSLSHKCRYPLICADIALFICIVCTCNKLEVPLYLRKCGCMWICVLLRHSLSHKCGYPLICAAIALCICILCICNKFGSAPVLTQMCGFVDYIHIKCSKYFFIHTKMDVYGFAWKLDRSDM